MTTELPLAKLPQRIQLYASGWLQNTASYINVAPGTTWKRCMFDSRTLCVIDARLPFIRKYSCVPRTYNLLGQQYKPGCKRQAQVPFWNEASFRAAQRRLGEMKWILSRHKNEIRQNEGVKKSTKILFHIQHTYMQSARFMMVNYDLVRKLVGSS